MKKAIIIGSGIAGLSAAIRLRNAGFNVHVFEANDYPGGKLTDFELNGFRFDAGPSLFTMPQLVEDLFLLSNKKMSESFSYRKKDVLCHYFFDDNTRFVAYADKKKYANEAARCFDVREDDVQNYFAKSKKKYDLTASLFLQKSLHKVSTYLNTDTIKALFSISNLGINNTLHEENTKAFSDPKMIQIFDRYATYNGSSPYRTPGIMSMIPHLEQHFGVYIPEGGMVSISNSLYRLACDLGVAFFFKHKVDEIIVEDNQAKGAVVNGKTEFADVIVSNMDVVPTYRNLLPGQKAPEKTLNQERSSSALIFYWGVKGIFPELELHNIFFAKDYKKEFECIFEGNTIADDLTVYINITSKDVPTDAPEGCENWFVMVNVPGNKGQDWDALITRARECIIRKLNDALHIDLNSLIVAEKILDPRGIESSTQSYQGSLYGAASNDKFAAFLRHPNFSGKIANLYFCGGSVHPGGGIPLCLLSGKIAAEIILKKN